MPDISDLRRIRRPRLLLSAARHGLRHYRAERDLERIARGPVPARAPARLRWLSEAEAQQEEARRARDAHYSAPHHVELLIALLSEAAAEAAQD